MALVRSIIRDAMIEIGVLYPEQTPSPDQTDLGLLRVQHMLDAWAASQLTLSRQLRTPFTMPSGTSEVTVGPGGTVNIARPDWVNALMYLNPGSTPAVEVPVGLMDADEYAALSIKQLPSALPTQAFYQTNLANAFGTLFVWPQVTQNVDMVLYTPEAVGVPATLNTDLIGPSGYQEAFMYQLALRLCTPFGVAPPPLLPGMAARAWTTMTRPNIEPGLLSIDPALVPGAGSGYNVYSDVTNSSR